MKFFLALMTSITLLLLVACGGGDSAKTVNNTSYTVTFNSNNGTTVSAITVLSGETIAEPTAPTKSDYSFDGWYKEVGFVNKWNFTEDKVEENINLYAKWKNSISLNVLRDRLKASLEIITYPVDSNVIDKVTVDWGDGIEENITSGFTNIQINHTYAANGIYSIVITSYAGSKINSQSNYSLKIANGIIITFEDARIENFIRYATGNDNYSIYDFEVLDVTDFNISSSNITSLAGMEYFKNLNELYIEDNNITDLSPLKDLNLTKFYCRNNPNLDTSVGSRNREIIDILISKGCIVNF